MTNIPSEKNCLATTVQSFGIRHHVFASINQAQTEITTIHNVLFVFFLLFLVVFKSMPHVIFDNKGLKI